MTVQARAPVRRFAAGDLRRFGEAVIESLGTPAATAAVVIDSLLEADRRGVETHGLVRLPSYCRQAADGEVRVEATPTIVRAHGATALVDGRHAFGALTGVFAMDEAIRRAEECGVAAVSAYHSLHFGSAAYYALRAAERELIGFAATNTPGVMAPFGGAEPLLGNNPFALAATLGDGRPPFSLDMAQTVAARGRVKLAETAGEEIPDGWALDERGRPTTDAAAALAGALLPFGGYKGYGLALAIELLAGVLSGAGLSPELLNTSMTGVPKARSGASVGTVGNLFLTIDPACFVGRAEARERLTRLADALKASRPAAGFDEVLIPGEPEARAAATSDAEGIGLLETTIGALRELALERGVAPLPWPS